MTDPVVPILEDILPGLHTPADDKAAALAEVPAGYPRIVPAGEDLSTMNPDTMTSVTDVRTPAGLLPVEKILAGQLGVDPDHLRLVKAHISDFGAVTLWQLLDLDGVTVEAHYIASYVAGTDRLQLVYAKKLEDGLRRYETVGLAHGVPPPDELALFAPEAVTGPPLPPLAEKIWGALVVKWTRAKQPARGGSTMCADCVTRVQELGVATAPVPRRAMWKRTGPNGDLMLCSQDAQNHRDEDAKVQREYGQRHAHDQHQARH